MYNAPYRESLPADVYLLSAPWFGPERGKSVELAGFSLRTDERRGFRAFVPLHGLLHPRGISFTQRRIGHAAGDHASLPIGLEDTVLLAQQGFNRRVIEKLIAATVKTYHLLDSDARWAIASEFASHWLNDMKLSDRAINRRFADEILHDAEVVLTLPPEILDPFWQNYKDFLAGKNPYQSVRDPRLPAVRESDIPVHGFDIPGFVHPQHKTSEVVNFMTPEQVDDYADHNFVNDDAVVDSSEITEATPDLSEQEKAAYQKFNGPIAAEDIGQAIHFARNTRRYITSGHGSLADALVVGANSNPHPIIQAAYLVGIGGTIDVTDLDMHQILPLKAELEALAEPEGFAAENPRLLARAQKRWNPCFDMYEGLMGRRVTPDELLEKCRFWPLDLNKLPKLRHSKWDAVLEGCVVESGTNEPKQMWTWFNDLQNAAAQCYVGTRINGRDGWGKRKKPDNKPEHPSVHVLPDEVDEGVSQYPGTVTEHVPPMGLEDGTPRAGFTYIVRHAQFEPRWTHKSNNRLLLGRNPKEVDPAVIRWLNVKAVREVEAARRAAAADGPTSDKNPHAPPTTSRSVA